MNKFWKWMEEKGYAIVEDKKKYGFGMVESIIHDQDNLTEVNPTKQMLIGYMIEYLLINGFISFRQIGIWLADQIKERALWKEGIVLNGDNHIDVIYDIIKQKIEELEEKK